ncbi:DUF447 domain-containing protein [Natronomonas sp. EA1]|uniref:DUF447 domain-containing protein n=1 Tax=Natronomonas sp. EA1 TaxID=3421655 RepID=UPI003EBBDE81
MSWPVELSGATESVVTTLGPNGKWNVAALGLFEGDPVRARTWGRTRTWRNFSERGTGYVQFTRDPVDFVEAACSIREEPDPILESADAWVRVSVEEAGSGSDGDTEWTDWHLHPEEHEVRREVVPTTNRAYFAIVEATVAASRLGVAGFDDAELRERIRYFESVVDSCAGARERDAWERFEALVDWHGDG